MAYKRELTSEEKAFCENLGGIVMFWNHVEATMRILLCYATGAKGTRSLVLVSNLGNVSLSEAMSAIADTYQNELSHHLKHCAALFDAERVYRNYYVHTPITFETTGGASQTVTVQITSKGGALRKHAGRVTTKHLVNFHNRLSSLQNYILALTNDALGENKMPLSSLEKPPLPDKLELKRLHLIEQKRPPQASGA